MARTVLKHIVTAGAAMLATLLIGCGSSNQSQDPSSAETSGDPKPAAASEDNTCTADAECAKDACCHAAGCIPSTRAPSCDDVMCTMDCKDGTMDCGKGACACIDGTCAVRWAE